MTHGISRRSNSRNQRLQWKQENPKKSGRFSSRILMFGCKQIQMFLLYWHIHISDPWGECPSSILSAKIWLKTQQRGLLRCQHCCKALALAAAGHDCCKAANDQMYCFVVPRQQNIPDFGLAHPSLAIGNTPAHVFHLRGLLLQRAETTRPHTV